jgi:hypothetical protein
VLDDVFIYNVKILFEKVAFTLFIAVAPDNKPELNITVELAGNCIMK